ncbi:MAG: hypothetical protein WED04_07680 [Promethearchaeati archaeon SRVP18_Atabeyarchaeia-1]
MCCRCNCEQHHHEEGREDEYGLCHTRRFLTKAEKTEKMKGYAEELRKELAAVEEHIKELES